MALIELRERWSPFRLLEEIRRDFEELEERLFGDWFDFERQERGREGGRRRRGWIRPLTRATLGATDIYEKDGKLVLETELPGVRREDLSVKVRDGHLIITAQAKRTEEIEEEDYYYMGRHYGRIQRAFQLPEEAIDDPKRIEAHFENGVLRVTVPLKESAKKRGETLEIQVR